MRPAIVLSEQRTGSNFLLSQLEQHPKIKSFGEVFSKKQAVGCPTDMTKEEYIERKRSDPLSLLKSSIFSRDAINNQLPVHLIKLQYQNIRRDAGGRLLELMQALRDEVRVIHLVRRNALERLVSKINAQKTEKYFVATKKEKPDDPDPYSLTYKIADRGMRKYLSDVDEMDEAFASFPLRHKIYYEDLVTNRVGEVQKVFEFLGVEPMRTKVQSVKQSLPARFQIRNYAVLRERFHTTPFAQFFEDSPGY